MDNLFQGFKEEPPLNKNNPPTAGAIYWDRSLFHRIKHTIIRFTSLEDMMTTEMGKAVIVAFFLHFSSAADQFATYFWLCHHV